MFGLSDDVGREAHLLCQRWQNILQERLHQVEKNISRQFCWDTFLGHFFITWQNILQERLHQVEKNYYQVNQVQEYFYCGTFLGTFLRDIKTFCKKGRTFLLWHFFGTFFYNMAEHSTRKLLKGAINFIIVALFV